MVIFEAIALSCFKKAVEFQIFYFGGVFFYAIIGYLLCQTFRTNGIGATNALWSAISILATTVVGVFIFKEVLHMHDYIAIFFIASGVAILRLTK